MPYDAFISYSHVADGKLAPRVESGLHRFARPEEGTEHRGRTVCAVGDGLPVEFNSVADAVRARSRCKTKCSGRPPRLRHREAGRRSLTEHRV
jgi:hypothetical protein